jgi:hypothetical protein
MKGQILFLHTWHANQHQTLAFGFSCSWILKYQLPQFELSFVGKKIPTSHIQKEKNSSFDL